MGASRCLMKMAKALANDNGCRASCSEPHEARQPRSRLILNVGQNMRPLFCVVGVAVLFASATAAYSVRRSADSKQFYAYEDAMRASIEERLRARLSPRDSEQKVEVVLKSMDLSWSYGPAGDGVHCVYSARRDLCGRAFLGVEVRVALEGGAWHFTDCKVTAHHPFL